MAGIKERLRYKDISWLMPSVDVEDVLERLNVEGISIQGDEANASCPDHHLFVGREPSHVHWSCNIETGETNCFTESRGSNLLWTVCRLLECEPIDAVRFMTGVDGAVNEHKLVLASVAKRLGRLGRRANKPEREAVLGLNEVKRDLADRHVSKACYQFFVHPEGKRPTDIQADTVDRYQVFHRTFGYYSNRAVIPFFMYGELVGFCAVDLLGQRKWVLNHPLKTEDDYRKTLYPANFVSSECLFGFDDVEKGCDYVIVTEGPREVMKLWQEGFPNSVAILGGYIHDPQIELLSRLAPRRVVVMFDGDEKGRLFTEKVGDKLKRLFTVGKAMVPIGLDPKNLNGQKIEKLLNSCF